MAAGVHGWQGMAKSATAATATAVGGPTVHDARVRVTYAVDSASVLFRNVFTIMIIHEAAFNRKRASIHRVV